jgi:hypothetical protein
LARNRKDKKLDHQAFNAQLGATLFPYAMLAMIGQITR